jgi:hypothetical protein
MYLDVRVEQAFIGEFAGGRSVLAAGEFQVNLVVLKHARFHCAANGAEETLEHFVTVASNGARRNGAIARGWAKPAGVGGGKSCRGAGGQACPRHTRNS